jgi:hypothetical protein
MRSCRFSKLAKSVTALSNKVDRMEAQARRPEQPDKQPSSKPIPEATVSYGGATEVRAHNWSRWDPDETTSSPGC